MTRIRIGSRGSALALAQTRWVKGKIEQAYPLVETEVVLIKTSGDRFLDSSLQSIGGKGIFVKEIEEALLGREIDLAVHSLKDLPTELPPGLVIAAVPEREDPRDALVSTNWTALKDLPSHAKIGTGSLRRKAQILHYRRDLRVVPIRGNVDTRLGKLDRGEVDGLVMAAAGLKRIGREERLTGLIPPELCLSAVAQGALGLECRENDSMHNELSFLHHDPTFLEVSAERSFLKRLGGGCQIPVGARAWVAGQTIKLAGVVADSDGYRLYRGQISGRAEQAERLGLELAERLLGQGADEVLDLERSGPQKKGVE